MNACTACGEDFGSVKLFDRHRVGRHAYTFAESRNAASRTGRRCLDPQEMEERAGGWIVAADGMTRPVTPQAVSARCPNSERPCEREPALDLEADHGHRASRSRPGADERRVRPFLG